VTNSEPIASYGLLADCNSAALVSRTGSIDWLCFPRYDSPSVFGRLLDPGAGHWSIGPVGGFKSQRRYEDGTLVITSSFETDSGTIQVVDALAFAAGGRGHEVGLDSPHEVLRLVEGIRGRVDVAMAFCPRPEYGLARPFIVRDGQVLRTRGGPSRLVMSCPVDVDIDGPDASARFTVESGASIGFALRWGPLSAPPPVPTPAARVAELLEDCKEAWRSWESDHDIYEGPSREVIRVSSRVLKGLTYRATGAIVAAPTTSLPETVGGERNWDYRYSWIRDSSLVLEALWVGSCSDEVENFIHWMVAAAGGHAHHGQPLQTLYGVGGEIDLSERVLPHLRGWRDSRPVRVGNAAWQQTQLDIYGEVLNALWIYVDRLGEPEEFVRHFIIDLADSAAEVWRKPDAGIWEIRAEPRHHMSSKLLCWSALDRGLKLARKLNLNAPVEKWTGERDAIRRAILEQGWSERRGAYTGHFGSDDLDASVLLMPLVGFLPANDPRMLATVRSVQRDLTEDGMVLRYRSDDGLEGDEGTFVICTFWLVSCLAMAGQIAEAEALFERVVGFSNDLGLLAEEIDSRGGQLLGNFPQAFSHVGLINAAHHIDEARERQRNASR
jgi:GH15 family glucan-1,4-alpha-glucosidase